MALLFFSQMGITAAHSKKNKNSRHHHSVLSMAHTDECFGRLGKSFVLTCDAHSFAQLEPDVLQFTSQTNGCNSFHTTVQSFNLKLSSYYSKSSQLNQLQCTSSLPRNKGSKDDAIIEPAPNHQPPGATRAQKNNSGFAPSPPRAISPLKTRNFRPANGIPCDALKAGEP